MGKSRHKLPCTRWLSPWPAQAESFLSLLEQTGVETTPRLNLGGDSISGTVRRFQSEAVFTGGECSIDLDCMSLNDFAVSLPKNDNVTDYVP